MPLLEVVFFEEECIEMAEHDGCWRLLIWREVLPVEVGLDSAIHVVSAEVRFKHGGVHKGQCQVCRDAAEEDWRQGRIHACWEGSNWEQGFSFVGGIVAWVRADNNQWWAKVAGWLYWGRLVMSLVRMACMP